MPGLTGREVFEILRERDPGLRILLSSGYSLSGDAQRMLELGATGFIQKPYRFKQLAVAVAEALRGPAER
jgi:CheY-like chemotaxis protein